MKYFYEIFDQLISFGYDNVKNSISSVLDYIVFVDKRIIYRDSVNNIFGDGINFGVKRIANTLIYGVLIYFVFKYLISKLVNEEMGDISSFIYRLVIAAILIGFSEKICEIIININWYITEEILKYGKYLIKKPISFKTFLEKINSVISIDLNAEGQTVNNILKGFVSFGLINLLLVYSLRYVYIKLLCLFLPFALVFNTNRKTEYIAKAWIKSFVGLLVLQNLVAIIIIMGLSVKFGEVHILGKVICVGCVYALMQINEMQRELIGGTSLYINNSFRETKGGI